MYVCIYIYIYREREREIITVYPARKLNNVSHTTRVRLEAGNERENLHGQLRESL